MLAQVHAAGDFGFLVYIVIMLVWAIGKATSAGKKGGKKPPGTPANKGAPPPRPRKPTLDPTLEDFLETLTGQKVERQVEPEPLDEETVLPLPPRPPRPGRGPRTRPQSQPPRPRLRDLLPQPSPPPTPAPPPPRAEPPPAQAPAAGLAAEELKDAPEFSYAIPEARGNVIESSEIGDADDHRFRPALGSMTALAGLDALRIPMSSHRLPHQPMRRTIGHTPVHIKGPANLRRALVDRILLGPPPSIDTRPLDIHPNTNP